MPGRCQAITKRGAQCAASPLPGRQHCLWHDPGAVQRRREISQLGGAARSNRARARREFTADALSVREIHGLVCTTLRAVMTGKLTAGVGAAVASLARVAVDIERTSELLARIEALEEAAGLRTRRSA